MLENIKLIFFFLFIYLFTSYIWTQYILTLIHLKARMGKLSSKHLIEKGYLFLSLFGLVGFSQKEFANARPCVIREPNCAFRRGFGSVLGFRRPEGGPTLGCEVEISNWGSSSHPQSRHLSRLLKAAAAARSTCLLSLFAEIVMCGSRGYFLFLFCIPDSGVIGLTCLCVCGFCLWKDRLELVCDSIFGAKSWRLCGAG